MPQFRVIVRDANGVERVAATVDTREDAWALVRALREQRPRVEMSLSREAADGTEAWIRTIFAPRERAEIEAIYLKARAEMKAAGIPDETIESMMPLTPDGRVPWD